MTSRRSRRMGIADAPPAAADRRRRRGRRIRLSAAAAAATGLTAGTPVSLGYVDVVCTALGAGILDRRRRRRLHDHRLDRHAHALRCAAERRSSQRRAHRLHDDAVPDRRRMIAQMQSNMAATLNIDWLLAHRARCRRHGGRQDQSASAAYRGIEGWVARRRARVGALSSLYLRGRRARAVRRQSCAGADSTASRPRTSFAGLMRAVFEGLGLRRARLLRSRSGRSPSEVRLTGGAGALARRCARSWPPRSTRLCASSSREEAGAAGAAMIAAVRDRRLPRHDANARRLGDARRSARREAPDPALERALRSSIPVYRDDQARNGRRLGRHLAARGACVSAVKTRVGDHRRSFHAAVDVREKRCARMRRRRRDPCASRAIGRTSRWSTAMPSRAWRA